jgi:hypothetical protein
MYKYIIRKILISELNYNELSWFKKTFCTWKDLWIFAYNHGFFKINQTRFLSPNIRSFYKSCYSLFYRRLCQMTSCYKNPNTLKDSLPQWYPGRLAHSHTRWINTKQVSLPYLHYIGYRIYHRIHIPLAQHKTNALKKIFHCFYI